MRFSEFASRIVEDDSADNNLVNVLSLIQYRIDKENLSPDYSTETILNLVRNSGSSSFSYGDLIKAYEDNPVVQNLISKPDKNRTEFIPISQELSDQDKDSSELDLEQPMDQLDTAMDAPDSALDANMSPSINSNGGPQAPTGDRDTVRSMAKKALSRRK